MDKLGLSKLTWDDASYFSSIQTPDGLRHFCRETFADEGCSRSVRCCWCSTWLSASIRPFWWRAVSHQRWWWPASLSLLLFWWWGVFWRKNTFLSMSRCFLKQNNLMSRCASKVAPRKATPHCSMQTQGRPRQRSRGRWKTSAGWTRWRSSTLWAWRSSSKTEYVRHGNKALSQSRWQTFYFYCSGTCKALTYWAIAFPSTCTKKTEPERCFW